jgi:hypothetical protein
MAGYQLQSKECLFGTRAPVAALLLAATIACGERLHRCNADLSMMADAIEMYSVDHKALPESLKTLVPAYLKFIPSDPWGSPYEYVREAPRYRLTSPGPDKVAGTPDDLSRTGITSIN